MTKLHRSLWLLLCLGFMFPGHLFAAEILLPQSRTVFQTNEWIDVSVVVPQGPGTSAGQAGVTLEPVAGAEQATGGGLAVLFPVTYGPAATHHWHINAALLRPGKYTLKTVDGIGPAATAEIEIVSHIRQSSFRLINWGRADKRETQLVQGEDSLGFNLFYGGYGRDDAGDFMRAGVDFMANCVMSGGHQMDLRMECDWSDPFVTKGGTRRVVRRAMIDRTRPNVPGVHFYDEPGLTWHKHPVTGEFGPHGVPAQVRSYQAAFGKLPPEYHTLNPNDPAAAAAWKHWATWKLGLMDAAWKESQFGVSQVRPDFLSLTQSQYGWSAFTDGYYFNVARSLPITSGHGGYHDYGLGTFNPSYFLEMARARDFGKPCWYLPTWYGNTTADQFRLEQYLSFQTGVQGLMSPPDCEPATNPGPRQGIVESNHLLKKLGPIFTMMRPTKPPVAMLFSLSQCIHTQTKDRGQNYAHAIPHGRNLPLTYLAGKLIQHQFFPVLDEDVLDGSLANDHRAIVLTSLDYLDPAVIAALEEFAASGGLVLLTADCTVKINGATKLPLAPRLPDQEKYDALAAAGNWQDAAQYATIALQMRGALSLGRVIDEKLRAANISPVLQSDQPTIVATRQAAGDIEYLFAVNATPDGDARNDKGVPINNVLKSIEAKLIFGQVLGELTWVYDAVHGRPMPISGLDEFGLLADNRWTGTFRFGPGQMRVFALTPRPIGGVRLAQPAVDTDLLLDQSPIRLSVAGRLVDKEGQVLSGSAPLRIRVIDSLGATRYDLYRATKQGQFAIELPLAANDPAGRWRVTVQEQLAGTESEVAFAYTPPRRATTLAGGTWRAVFTAADDDNVFRFARTHQDVTIVAGSSDFNAAAAERLTKILAPWGIRCKTMPLAEAAKSRSLTEEEARTWAGLIYAGTGQIKPGDANPPSIAGFAVQGPVILLGNPQDNPIIDFLAKEHFLPYSVDKEKFPGVGRGMFAWQRDGIGAGQESLTLIAYDAAGMEEAVGSVYEAAAGIEPLTRWTRPNTVDLGSVTKYTPVPQSNVFARLDGLPDRVVGLGIREGELHALSNDQSLAKFSLDGIVRLAKLGGPVIVSGAIQTISDAAELVKLRDDLKIPTDAALQEEFKKYAPPTRLVKSVTRHGENVLSVYWGGELDLRAADGKLRWRQRFDQDITALATDGTYLFLGLADGRIFGIR